MEFPAQKRRPGLVVGGPIGDDVVLAFITSRLESVDPAAEHLLAPDDPEFRLTGLKVASRIRLSRLSTVHRFLLRRRLGRIGPNTRRAVERALRFVLEL